MAGTPTVNLFVALHTPQDLSRCAAVSKHWSRCAAAALLQRRRDLSLGAEPVQLQCVNTVDGEPFPAATYIPTCRGADEPTRMLLEGAETEGCTCTTGDCHENASSCACLGVLGHRLQYDGHGRLLAAMAQPLGRAAAAAELPAVFECGERCRCDAASCGNRVVSRGVRVRLQVFKSARRGWGVRALEALPRASFVCEYAGELLSVSEAKRRRAAAPRGDNYMMVVNERLAGEARTWRTTIDPTYAGNVGRYLNHSCRPNLLHALVRLGSSVPRVAFFCARDISAGEELTIFYGTYADRGGPAAAAPGREGGKQSRGRPCLCGEAECLGFLPCDCEFEETR